MFKESTPRPAKKRRLEGNPKREAVSTSRQKTAVRRVPMEGKGVEKGTSAEQNRVPGQHRPCRLDLTGRRGERIGLASRPARKKRRDAIRSRPSTKKDRLEAFMSPNGGRSRKLLILLIHFTCTLY